MRSDVIPRLDAPADISERDVVRGTTETVALKQLHSFRTTAEEAGQ